MKNSDIDVGQNLTEEHCCASNFYRRRSTSRRGEILDTLVILIAGSLLPVWLLGHLFLTIYPVPDATLASADADLRSEQAEVSGEAQFASAVSDDRVANPNVDSDTAVDSSVNDTDRWRKKFESIDSQFNALTTQSKEAQSNNDRLKKLNVSLESENKKLLAKLESLQSTNDLATSEEDRAKAPSNSAVVAELQSELSEISATLKSERVDFLNAKNNLDVVEKQRQALQDELASVRSDLALAESKRIDAEKNIARLETEAADSIAKMAQSADEDKNENQSENLAAANQKIAALEKSVNLLTEQNRTATTNLTKQQAELRVAQQQVKSLTSQNNKLQVSLDRDNQSPTTQPLPALTAPEVYREFISSKGNSAKMAFVRWEEDEIVFRNFADKKLYRLTLDRFSESDKRYLLERK